MTWSSLRASFEVNFSPISKRNTPLQRHCNYLNENSLYAKLQEGMTSCDGRSKLADTSTPRLIGRDTGDAGQSVSCSMAIITRSDFDCAHEVSSKSLAIDSKKNGLHSFSRDQPL